MRIAVTGSSGLVGSMLVPKLQADGNQVSKLVREAPSADDEIRWDPDGAKTDTAALDGIDAMVHLAGENIAGKRWNDKVKQRIRDSRVDATRHLCADLAQLTNKPRVLVSASAIGYYGDSGDTVLKESSPAGDGFLPDVAKDWEAATQAATDTGIRVVNMRFGVILSPQGGALQQMLTPFKMCVGGRIGSGQQYWSWIAIDDVIGAIQHALATESLQGPANTVAPNPATNAEFTKTLGKVLGRPTIMPMPALAARLALGEMADELLLASLRVEPAKLLATGYEFQYPKLDPALRHLLK